MATESYYYGQGRVSIAKRGSNGQPGAFRFIGDVSALTVQLEVEKVEHKESYSGQKALVRSFPIGKTATVNMTMHQIDPDNLALALYGTTQSTDGDTVTGEALPDNLVVGDEVSLANPGVSDVVIKDSAGSPETLEEGTHYTLDAGFGRITILDVGSFEQPFKVDYKYGARKSVGMFTAAQPEFFLKFEGYNLAEGNAPTIVNLYKVASDPMQELALITDGNDVAGMQVSGGILLDSAKPPSGALGQFGDITQVVAE